MHSALLTRTTICISGTHTEKNLIRLTNSSESNDNGKRTKIREHLRLTSILCSRGRCYNILPLLHYIIVSSRRYRAINIGNCSFLLICKLFRSRAPKCIHCCGALASLIHYYCSIQCHVVCRRRRWRRRPRVASSAFCVLQCINLNAINSETLSGFWCRHESWWRTREFPCNDTIACAANWLRSPHGQTLCNGFLLVMSSRDAKR